MGKAIDIAALIAAGVAPDVIEKITHAQAVEAYERASLRRQKDRERKRSKRRLKASATESSCSRNVSAECPRNVRGHSADAPSLSSFKKEVGDRGGLRAREADKLADEIAIIAGYANPDMRPLCWHNGGPGRRVEMWLASGWQPAICLEIARAVMKRKRDGPPLTINYFERAIARAHAANTLPLPTVQTGAFDAQADQRVMPLLRPLARKRGYAGLAADYARRAAGDDGS